MLGIYGQVRPDRSGGLVPETSFDREAHAMVVRACQ